MYINIEEKKCVHQLISITHDIYKAFDADPSLEVRGVFLDLSKAFDKVWDDGLLYELRRMGICERYFEPIHSFLSDGFQRVLLNGQNSKWSQIIAGVPQCSVLGPLLFLVYIYDSPYIVYIYMIRFSRWFVTQVLYHYLLMRTYPKYPYGDANGKCWLILILQNKLKRSSSRKKILLTIMASTSIMPLNRKNTQKYLGLNLDAKLNFSENKTEKIKKAVKGISVIEKLNVTLSRSFLLTTYKSFIRPHLDYGDVIYDQPNNNRLSEKIESVQYNAA